MIREHCFWLTTIKGQGGSEYYCEAPYNEDVNFNCENCKKYINTSDMQELTKELLKAVERCFEWV